MATAQAFMNGVLPWVPIESLRLASPCRVVRLQDLPARIILRHCSTKRVNICANLKCTGESHEAGLDHSLAEQNTGTTESIDDKIISALSQRAGGDLRQVILLTDGVDDRIHRLSWPPMTIIFHVSSSETNIERKNVSKSVLVRQILGGVTKFEHLEILMESLKFAGYQGNKPSIWVMQGLKALDQNKLRNALDAIGRLAMKGSFVVGALPRSFIEGLNMDAGKQLIEKIFLSCGFHMKLISYNEHKDSVETELEDNITVYAEQLRLSDDQVNKVIREIELAEESGDEENFEDW